MKRFATLFLLPISLAWLGCGMGAADQGAEAPGGNVGFGGAQDIGQFRSLLDAGQIPGEQTLDANGFFNEHFAPLPPPDCGQQLCLQSMLSVGASWVDGSYQATLQIALNTPRDPAEAVRAPLNLVVVVDTSGSMADDDRLVFAKQGLHLLIDELDDTDRLALVSYASGVTVHRDLSAPLDRAALHAVVDGLSPNGSTNFYGGLQAGFELSLAALDLERQNRVIMLSDGNPTAGITDDESIILMATDYIGSGIGLTTIGVGLDFNVGLMRGLAERGAGNFYFLEDAEAIDEVFTEEIDFFVEPIALGVDVRVLSADQYELGEVVGTRLWKAEGNAGSMFVPAVFLASRQSDETPGTGRRGGGSAIFLQLIPRGGATLSEVAQVSLRYRLPGSDELLEQTITVTNPAAPGELPEQDYFSHETSAKLFAMYNLFLGLREATRSAAFNYDCAASQLSALDAEADRWNRDFADDDITRDRALIAQFIGNLREHGAQDPATITYDACNGFVDHYYDDDYYAYACDAGQTGLSGPAGTTALAVLLGLALVTRRRRRA